MHFLSFLWTGTDVVKLQLKSPQYSVTDHISDKIVNTSPIVKHTALVFYMLTGSEPGLLESRGKHRNAVKIHRTLLQRQALAQDSHQLLWSVSSLSVSEPLSQSNSRSIQALALPTQSVSLTGSWSHKQMLQCQPGFNFLSLLAFFFADSSKLDSQHEGVPPVSLLCRSVYVDESCTVASSTASSRMHP